MAASAPAGRGRFITLEGIEGAGKSTQIEAITAFLGANGVDVVATREPGGTRLGEAIRSLLIDPSAEKMSSDAELLLMFAARAEHIAKLVEPSLAAGRWVVCDRFTDATYAYQGAGRGVAAERIATLEQWVQGDLRPDLVLLLDLPVRTGAARVGRRGDADRFELESGGFFERIRRGYLEQARAHPDRYRTVDASGSPESVREALLAILAGVLESPDR